MRTPIPSRAFFDSSYILLHSPDTMNAHNPIELINDAECSSWPDIVVQKRQQLLDWASTIHPQRLACQIEGTSSMVHTILVRK
jgi:hypothetical protein